MEPYHVNVMLEQRFNEGFCFLNISIIYTGSCIYLFNKVSLCKCWANVDDMFSLVRICIVRWLQCGQPKSTVETECDAEPASTVERLSMQTTLILCTIQDTFNLQILLIAILVYHTDFTGSGPWSLLEGEKHHFIYHKIHLFLCICIFVHFRLCKRQDCLSTKS